MNAKPNAKKLVQISEEAQTPVHVPIVLGNECFIITQQDVRRVEDTRLLSYSKLAENGQLIPMEQLGHDCNASEAILNAFRMQQQQQQQQANTQHNFGFAPCGEQQCGVNNLNALSEYMNRFIGAGCAMDVDGMKGNGIPMQAYGPAYQPPLQTIASLRQQLQWANANNNSSAPYPLTYSTSTSTSELGPRVRFQGGNDCCCCQCKQAPSVATRGCNTVEFDVDQATQTCSTRNSSVSARAQLKQKKMTQECSYIS